MAGGRYRGVRRQRHARPREPESRGGEGLPKRFALRPEPTGQPGGEVRHRRARSRRLSSYRRKRRAPDPPTAAGWYASSTRLSPTGRCAPSCHGSDHSVRGVIEITTDLTDELGRASPGALPAGASVPGAGHRARPPAVGVHAPRRDRPGEAHRRRLPRGSRRGGSTTRVAFDPQRRDRQPRPYGKRDGRRPVRALPPLQVRLRLHRGVHPRAARPAGASR